MLLFFIPLMLLGLLSLLKKGKNSVPLQPELKSKPRARKPSPFSLDALCSKEKECSISQSPTVKVKGEFCTVNIHVAHQVIAADNINARGDSHILASFEWDASQQSQQSEVKEIQKNVNKEEEWKNTLETFSEEIRQRSGGLKEGSEEKGILRALEMKVKDSYCQTKKNLDTLENKYQQLLSTVTEKSRIYTEDRAKMSKYVLRLEERDRCVLNELESHLRQEPGRLLTAAEKVFNKYNVRLLGVRCGLGFLCEVPAEQFEADQVMLNQIQCILAEVLPEDKRKTAVWTNVRRTSAGDPAHDVSQSQKPGLAHSAKFRPGKEGDTRNGPVCINQAGASASCDIKCSHCRPPEPKQLHSPFVPRTEDDKNLFGYKDDRDSVRPQIVSMAILENGLTAVADAQNMMLKIVSTEEGKVVSYRKLLFMPYFILQLQDRMVAVTSCDENTIALCDVIDDLTVPEYVKTKRHYIGIGPGPESGLIVSRCADAQGDAGVDLISRDGQVLREIWNGNGNGTRILQGLTVIDDDILVADNGNNVVLRIAFATGLLVDNSLQATKPTHVACDDKKYVYVASSQEKTVWVIGQGNKKRALLTGDVNGDTDRVCPCGLAVKEARIIVSWSSDNDKDGSSIIEYKL